MYINNSALTLILNKCTSQIYIKISFLIWLGQRLILDISISTGVPASVSLIKFVSLLGLRISLLMYQMCCQRCTDLQTSLRLWDVLTLIVKKKIPV